MNRDDVIDVLSVVAAATRRTVGEADVKIWQEIIGADDKQLALRAVRDHLAEKPGVWLEPGHVHQRVRAYRRDQLEREPDEARAARQEALSAKAVEDAAELAERKGIPGPERFVRPDRSALHVRCPFDGCKAAIGRPCVNSATGKPRRKPHPSRLESVSAATELDYYEPFKPTQGWSA